MFIFRWVLINELAIGNVPENAINLNFLERKGIKSILTLCSEEDFVTPDKDILNIKLIRYVLPDHRSSKEISDTEILDCLKILNTNMKNGPVYVHCKAGMERSPLICMAWLMYKKKLTLTQSLDYMMQVHQSTNPIPKHLKILENLNYIIEPLEKQD